MHSGGWFIFLVIHVFSISCAQLLYTEYLPQLVEGDVIAIHGRVWGPNNRFHESSLALHLCPDPECDRVMLKMEIDEGDTTLLSAKSRTSTDNKQEDASLKLRRDSEIQWRITVEKEHYRIKVDNEELKPFEHHIPFTEIRLINVQPEGVTLFDIGWEEFSVYNRSISNVKLGDEIHIKGKALAENYKFAMSLCTDEKCTVKDLYMEIDNNVTTVSSLRNNQSIKEQRFPTNYIEKDKEFTIHLTLEADHSQIVSSNVNLTHPHIVKYDQIRYMEIRCMRSLLLRKRIELLGVEWNSRPVPTTTPIPTTIDLSAVPTHSDHSKSDDLPYEPSLDEAEPSVPATSPSERSIVSVLLLMCGIIMCSCSVKLFSEAAF